MGKPQNKVLIVLAFFSIYVIWGSTYMLNKMAVAELPPFMIAAIRFVIAGLLIFMIAKFMGISISISKKQLKNTAIAGLLFLTIGNGIAVWALMYLDSGFAALEVSAQPLVVLLLMLILQGKKIQPMSILGVIFGVVGIYLSQKEIVSQENSIIGMIMLFVCMLSWAYGSLFVAKADLPSNYFVNTGYQMLTGGIMLLIASLLFGEKWSLPSVWSGQVQVSMILLIVFGSIVAFTSFNYLLKMVSPEKVATCTYVNPAVILLTGVYFINTKKKLDIFSKSAKS